MAAQWTQHIINEFKLNDYDPLRDFIGSINKELALSRDLPAHLSIMTNLGRLASNAILDFLVGEAVNSALVNYMGGAAVTYLDDAVNMFLGSYTMDQMGLIEAAVIAAITVKFNHKVQELNMIPQLNEAGQMAGDDVSRMAAEWTQHIINEFNLNDDDLLRDFIGSINKELALLRDLPAPLSIMTKLGRLASNAVLNFLVGEAVNSALVNYMGGAAVTYLDDAVNMFLGSYTMDQMGLIEAAVIAAITVKFNHKVQELNMIPHLNEAGQMAGDDVHSVVGGN